MGRTLDDLGEIEMNWLDRANVIRRFCAEGDASQPVGWRRARAGREAQGLVEDSRRKLINQSMASITAYHKAGESDDAFAGLDLETAVLADAAARLDQGCVSIGDSLIPKVRVKIGLMYGANSGRVIDGGIRCDCRPAGRLRAGRT